MDIYEIKQILKSKSSFDDYSFHMLSEYFDGVNLSFKNYISIDDALNRILDGRIENGIKIVDSSQIKTVVEGCDASYSFTNKCINLDESLIKYEDELYIKYIVFHELTHAISMHMENGKYFYGLQENGVNIYKNLGIDEAITEYLTYKIMKEKYNYIALGGYECAVEQLNNVFNIIDEVDLIKSYFYNSKKYEELIKNSSIDDAEFFEFAFNILINKEKSVVQIRKREYPEDEFDTVLLAIKEQLYMWYTEKYLPVDSIQKFEKKLNFVSKFIHQRDSLNFVDEYATYVDILCDIQDLKELGYDENELFKLFRNYNLDRERFEKFGEFYFTDSNEINDDKRTEKIIELYNLYSKIGRNEFCDICDGFFMRLYRDFFLEKPQNAYDLYNYFKLPIIGKFLKENPKYDLDELTVCKVDYRRILGQKHWDDYFYILKTLDNKFHLIFEEFNDGTIFKVIRISDNRFMANYKNINLEFLINDDEILFKDLNESNSEFAYGYAYCKKSNLDYVKDLMEKSDGPNREFYENVFNDMNQRINERKQKSIK